MNTPPLMLQAAGGAQRKQRWIKDPSIFELEGEEEVTKVVESWENERKDPYARPASE